MRRTVGESELCFESDGPVEFVDTAPFIASMGEGAWVVLAAIGDGVVQRLEITPADGGLAHTWTVDGEPRSFDDEAVAWRDAMFDVFQPGLDTGFPIASARAWSPLDPRAAISSWDARQSELAARARTTVGRIAALESAMVATEDEETRARLGEEVASLREAWEAQQRELEAEREQRVEMLREQMEQQIESMRQQAEEYRLRSQERRFQLEEYLLQRDSATAISGLGPGLRAYRDDVDSLAAEIAWLRLLAQPRPITSAHDAERAADAEARLRELIPSIR